MDLEWIRNEEVGSKHPGSLSENQEGSRSERRGGRCKAVRRRRCRCISSRSANAADARAPPEPEGRMWVVGRSPRCSSSMWRRWLSRVSPEGGVVSGQGMGQPPIDAFISEDAQGSHRLKHREFAGFRQRARQTFPLAVVEKTASLLTRSPCLSQPRYSAINRSHSFFFILHKA